LVATAGLGDPDSNDAENRFSALFGKRIARLTASIRPDAPATARAKLGQNAELANARAAKHSMLSEVILNAGSPAYPEAP